MKVTAALAMLAAVLTLAACTAASATSAARTAAQASSAYTPSPGYTPPAPMPSAISSLPDGVYRTRVLQADLVAKGGDPADAGTWTFTLTRGAYTLACQWTDEDGNDCGRDGYAREVVVEMGPTRGDGTAVYFASDLAATEKLNGCSPASLCTGAPSDPYRLDWKATGDSLVLTNFMGYGDQASMTPVNNFTIQPWTKIG
jgi:hypothetical protein